MLFERVAVPLATAGTQSACLCQRQLIAVDGVFLDVADTPENDATFSQPIRGDLSGPYPQAKVVKLAECDTHAIIAAQISGCHVKERELTSDLLRSLEPDMLLLADRGFFTHEFCAEVAARGADLLWLVSASVALPVLEVFDDNSYRSVIIDTIERQHQYRATIRAETLEPAETTVRVVEYQITNRDTATDTIHLVTTITDPADVTAAELAAAYAQRCEFEISLAELETRQRGPLRVLRSLCRE